MKAATDPEIAAREKAKRQKVRDDRLKAALKGNMARRKAQAKAMAGKGVAAETKTGADDNAAENE